MSGQGYIKELRKTLVLAAPITAGHVSQMLLGVADTVMIGRVGVVPLAASALAHTLVHFVFIVGIGLLTSVSVLVAHAYGAGNKHEAGEMLRRGLAIGITCGLLMFFLLWASFPLLDYLGQPAEVVAACKPYLWLLASSLPLMLVIICFRNYSEAQDAPWPAFWVGLAAVLLNIFLNWVFIYGNLGAPALGLPGAGIATVIARVFNVVALIVWLRLDARFIESWPRKWLAVVPWGAIAGMLRLGFPVSLQLLMEIGAFASTTLLMGWLGVVEMAAHQIAITCAATTFMVPLGISLAVAIRVGHVIGAGQPERARPVAFSALGFGFLCSLVFAAAFLLFNRQLAGFFTEDPATLGMAASLIVVAGFFQVFDGAQVMGAGALRGCKDVRIPTWIIFGAYWIVAIPFGAFLAFGLGYDATGLWTGLAAGLAFAAVGLVARFNWMTGMLLSDPIRV